MQNKFIHSNKGMTLIELLASIVILSFVSILIYSVLYNGIKSYERTIEEAKLRDEADYIMANLIDKFFVLKSSEITSYPDESANINYITVSGNGGKAEFFGFKDGKIYVGGEELKLSNGDIELSRESKLISISDSEFKVKLILKSKVSNQKLELTSMFNILDDRKEGTTNATN
ncbi:type II secretion system protein J [Caldifermentibacillus hisashii]|uniref:PulJ/GspJ family protein n=1 Tax=Caldifermentibacillus hisashii TaxID=996558 RepID=UPI0034D738DF